MRVVPTAKRLAVGLLAASAVSLGAGGVAAAAPAPNSHPKPHHQFNCARAPRLLARIQKVEADLQAGLPGLHAAEQKAKAAGKLARADRIQRRIDRLESPKTKTRLDRMKQRIEAKCGPAASSSATGAAAGQAATA